MFVELKAREYYKGGQITVKKLVSVFDIAEVSEYPKDCSCSLLHTRKGETYLLAERYDDVLRKIQQASERGANNAGT